LTESCKQKLDKYKYDSQKFSKIIFNEREQILEVEVPVFIGEKYRLVFNTSGLPKPVTIEVYTKDRDSKKREAIFSTKDSPATQTDFTFDVAHVRHLFVDYIVPINSGAKIDGCVAFMLGYSDKI